MKHEVMKQIGMESFEDFDSKLRELAVMVKMTAGAAIGPEGLEAEESDICEAIIIIAEKAAALQTLWKTIIR